MLRIQTATKINPEEAIKQGVAFFGPGGLGLTVQEQAPDYARLEGGGGYVEMSSSQSKKDTKVDFVTQEWEIQVKEFINRLKH